MANKVMSLFGKKTTKKVEKRSIVSQGKKDVSNGKDVKKQSESNRISARSVVDKVVPWITEKTQMTAVDGKYVFKIPKKVNKNQLRKMISDLYQVKIKKVNMVNIKGKKKRFAGKLGRRSDIRKAIVTLEKGYKIDFFE